MSHTELAPTTTEPLTPAQVPPDASTYTRLTQTQLGLILNLAREGKQQVQIAHMLGVHQSTIARALAKLGVDTTELAKHRAAASAYRRVARLDTWTKKRDSIGLKAAQELNQIAGLTGNADGKGVSVGIQVVIGMPNQPAGPDPLTLEVGESGGAKV